MFYLIEFFKSLGESLLRGFFFFLFSCLLAFSLTHRSWIARTIDRVSPEKIVNPYFVAVVDNAVDSQRLVAIVNQLPGVTAIDDTEAANSKSKLQKLVGQLGKDYELSSELMAFKSLKIVLNPSLSVESLQFVRDQVVKMGGREHVTATDVKYPEVSAMMKAHPFYSFLKKAGDWGVVGVIAFCWIISFWLCYDVFRSRSYIIEKFQRKKMVAAKSLATGLSVVVVCFGAFGVWNGTLKLLDFLLLLMIFSVFWTFSMQEWKWKPTI